MTISDPDFNVLAPLEVGDAALLSGIPDAENQVYSGATTYNTDDLVWRNGHVWRSLVDDNTGNTPVEGANWTDLGEIDEGAGVYNAGTTYAVDDFAVYQGALWQSSQDSNTGNTPSETGTEWTRMGATSRFKPFDSFLQDAAEIGGPVTMDVEVPSLVTTIAILRSSGVSVEITMTDATEGEVFNETFPMIDLSGITDWFEWLFGETPQSDTILIEGLPPYAGATITMAFEGTDLSIGQIVLGSPKTFGTVIVGARAGIEDFSLKERDAFGRFFVLERTYSNTALFPVKVPILQTGFVLRQLALRRAQKTLYYMSEGAPYGLVVYGYFSDAEIFHSNSVLSELSIEVEDLG